MLVFDKIYEINMLLKSKAIETSGKLEQWALSPARWVDL